jgi:membrane-associated phospholipid phosphatase
MHWALALGIAILWLIVALALDKATFLAFKKAPDQETDFLRLLRIQGVLPTWALVAIAFLLIDLVARKAQGARAVFFRASLLMASTILCGIIGELAKLLIRRERPELHDGEWVFRPYSQDFWVSKNLGMPSTHAIVAFAAAWALYRLHPAGWPVYFFLAAGCAVTRLIAQAHFLSDVYLACVISYFVVRTLSRFWVDPTQPTLKTNS